MKGSNGGLEGLRNIMNSSGEVVTEPLFNPETSLRSRCVSNPNATFGVLFIQIIQTLPLLTITLFVPQFRIS
jgi:hypothetical protein